MFYNKKLCGKIEIFRNRVGEIGGYMSKYNKLIKTIIDEICEKEGLKIGQRFSLRRKALKENTCENVFFTQNGLSDEESPEGNCWSHIIYGILEEEFIIVKENDIVRKEDDRDRLRGY